MADLFGESPHDAGGKARWKLLPGVVGAAEFHGERDVCRLTLDRSWDSHAGTVGLFIGQNPSTAEASVDDTTIRKGQHFTRRAGLDRYRMMNVCPYRSTDPSGLTPEIMARWHEINMAALRRSLADVGMVVAAWGAVLPFQRPYARELLQVVREAGLPVLCLGQTKDGSPRHPCRLAHATLLEHWEGAEW